MKKLILFIACVALAGLTACTGKTAATVEEEKVPAAMEYQYEADLNTLDDVIRYSTNIVKATLTSIEDFDGAFNVYLFDILEDYTENTLDEIHMYDAYYEEYIPGHSYYLFLYGSDSALYPHTIYTTVLKELIVDVESTQSTATIGGETIEVVPSEADELISTAIAEGIVGEKAGSMLTVSDSSSVSSISQEADVIAEIRISWETEQNRYVSTYGVELVDLLKGPEGSIAQIMNLPPDLDPDTNYYVFLKEDPENPGVFLLYSRVYPVAEVTPQNTSALSLD